MATLIFDIETIGEPWESFDESTQKIMTRWIERTTDSKAEYTRELQKLKEQLGFSPLTGTIIALGMYDLERHKGAVYFVGDASKESYVVGDFTFKERTERDILEDFWDGAHSYDTFVTFNGRGFDVPFLLHRSVVHGLRPSATLLGKRYLSQQTMPYHIDLQDELTFYGVMNKRPSLHLLCRAYGIDSPKLEVDGHDVAELFRQKRFRDIAAYNARNVVATTALYETWKQFLAPPSFLNTIEF